MQRSLKISKNNLMDAALHMEIKKEQTEKLWTYLSSKNSSAFNVLNVLFYFGTFIIFLGLGWYMADNYNHFNSKALFITSFCYVLFFWAVGTYLWKKSKYKIVGGLGIFIALSLIPLTTYAFQKMMGLWPKESFWDYRDFYSYISGGWFFMEAATIIATLIAIRFIKFPFLTSILYMTLWFMSMDIAPFIFGQEIPDNFPIYTVKKIVTLFYGLGAMSIAFMLDRKGKKDWSFWGYFFGVIAFWGGATFLTFNTPLGLPFYCLINLILIFVSPILKRKVFLVFGILGMLNFLNDIAQMVNHSILFPLILSAVGIGIIGVGIHRQKKMQVTGSDNIKKLT